MCRGTLSRKHIQAASRRRHPRQAYHRHRLRPKKGSQPWRRRWLSFDSELPSWRSTPRARPLVQDSHGLGLGARSGPGARIKLRLEVLTGSRQERYPAHGLWSGLARPGARTLTQPAGPEPPEPARRAATSAPPPPTAPPGLPHSAEPAAEPLDLGGLPLRQLADAPGSVDNLRNAELDNLQNAELEPRLRRLEEENLAGRLEVVEASLREALERVASLEKQVAELQWWAEAAS